MALILKHQTVANFIARFREAYRNGERSRLVALARFILARIASGDLTDAQCRSAFGLSAAQWTALKTKMTNYVNADSTIRGAVGE